jgi:hypothetical protein
LLLFLPAVNVVLVSLLNGYRFIYNRFDRAH